MEDICYIQKQQLPICVLEICGPLHFKGPQIPGIPKYDPDLKKVIQATI